VDIPCYWIKLLITNERTYIFMAKRNKSRKPRKNRSSKEISITAPARVKSQVPRAVSKAFKIRRTWVQPIDYNPVNGWANTGYQTVQMNFTASASDVRIGGVSVYTPSLPNTSEFTNLFDQWKIKQVTTRFDWSINTAQPSSDVSYASPLIFLVLDHDDSLDASVNDLLQYPGMVTHSFLTGGYKPLIVTHTPRPLRDVAGSGISTSYSPASSNPFISTTNLLTPHYGIKFAARSMGASVNAVIGQLLITCFIDMEFVNPK